MDRTHDADCLLRNVLLSPDDFFDSLTHDTDLKFKEVQPFELASISGPLNMKVICVRVLEGAVLVFAYPRPGPALRDAPNLAVPNNIVYATLRRASD